MTEGLWNRLFGDFGRLITAFLAVTLLLLSLALHRSLPRFEEHFQQARRRTLEERLDRLVGTLTGDYPVNTMVQTVLGPLVTHGPFHPEVERAAREIVRKGLVAEFYVYREFVFQRTIPDGLPETEGIRQILLGTTRSGEALAQAQREVAPVIDRLFGSGNRLELIKRRPNGWNSFGPPGAGNRLQCLHLPAGYEVMVILRGLPSPLSLFADLPPAERDTAALAIPTTGLWVPPAGVATADLEIAWEAVRSGGGAPVRQGGLDWALAEDNLGRVWGVVQPVGTSPVGRLMSAAIVAGYGGAGVLLCLFALAVAGTPWGRRLTVPLNSLSIRVQFFALFFLTALVPLGMALLVGVLGQLDRREVQFAEAMTRGRQVLLGFEQAYHACLTEFEQTARRLRDSPEARAVRTAALASEVMDLVEAVKLQRLELRDAAGRTLFTNLDPAIHGTSSFLETFCRIAVRRHVPRRPGQPEERISAEDVFSEALLSGLDPGFLLPLRQRGRVWIYRLGNGSPTLLYWDVYPDAATGPAFIVLAHQLGWTYEAWLDSVFRTRPGAGLPVTGRAAGRPGPDPVEILPPLQGPDRDKLAFATLRCNETQETLFREIALDDGLYWAIFKPELELTRNALFHLVPVAAGGAGGWETAGPLAGCAALSLLVAFFAARLMTALFIVPIRDLSAGIDAIQARDHAWRIPWRRSDELGVVVEAFNRSLAEMKELQYGRIVQESLLPAAPPVVEGYDLVCWRCPASELAGDYHDLFRLPDGRLVILIGDVTGHGIAAALAMAMAKATVGYQQIAGWSFPGQVMEHLNRLFHLELRPQGKLMTMGCLVLDPVTHLIEYENAGHPYPLIHRAAGGKVEELQAPGFPLGMRGRRPPDPFGARLDPGDTLFLFTDGLPECTGGGPTNLFSYERVRERFDALCQEGRPAGGILEELRRELDAFRDPGPYPDDVTLIIVRRRVG
ncbi:MAG: SpoIIE family protein phosphatase [Candidatus Riflebacteria bacterium]|nr:SpoIIE family protein phosphatase [Candidatus Riflebacteria bacterium]